MVPVWDVATRVFHWSLVCLVAAGWLTGGTGSRWHEVIGFAVGGLILFRLAWGFTGTQHARFSDFVTSPRAAMGYVHGVLRLRVAHYRGHNPAGGLMILLLLALLVVIVTTGIMQLTNRFFGVPWVETTHYWATNVLLVFVPMHVLGAIVSSWVHQENLIKAMWTGVKPVEAHETDRNPQVQEQRFNDRIRGLEGLVMLTVLVTAGALYGWTATDGRQSTIAPDERVPARETPNTATEAALTRAIQEAAVSFKDKQDFVIGGPGEGSQSWIISSGGRLYDNWFAALGIAGPKTTHPAWPATNTSQSGDQTWRCKSCHGWDYMGRDGQNRSGPNTTGITGLLRARGRTPEQIMMILGNSTHGFTDEIIPPHAKYRLALFVSQGQHTMQRYLNPNGTVRGEPVQGRAIFQTVCAACHGFDGRARKLGISADPDYKGAPLYIGSKATGNITEVLHKIRNGHPGVAMVSLRAFPIEQAINLLAYVQTLPRE